MKNNPQPLPTVYPALAKSRIKRRRLCAARLRQAARPQLARVHFAELQAQQRRADDSDWAFWRDREPPDASMVIEIRRGRLSEPFRTTAARLGPYFNIASVEWRPAED
jgi:hypothetical protein